jgi:hypothetical protein
MRHFTPDRWLRLQDVSDERTFHAAHADWQHALSDYRQELERNRPLLSLQLLRFAEDECLHDAILLADWRGRVRLNLLVQPEQPTERLFLLTYSLVEPARVVSPVLPKEHRSERAVWMYDEIGVEGDTFTHSILLGDGREIELRFDRFTFTRPQIGIPDAAALSLGAASVLSHSA